ncbi:MAG TPA: hypothetical protein VHO25_23605 [Polyangiaceae bacterium]|nr:hypothetical protein [Polyangiaceae bacterium]
MNPSSEPALTPAQRLIVLWGIGGVLLLLLQAVYRLSRYAIEPWREGSLNTLQIVVCLVWIVIAAYSEGYKAFHLRFCPRVIARALHVARHPRPVHVVLAPAFCMALFHARSRTKKVAWLTLILILCAIALLRITPQPWRGIVDAGVVVGIGLGALSLLFHAAQTLSGQRPPASPELP